MKTCSRLVQPPQGDEKLLSSHADGTVTRADADFLPDEKGCCDAVKAFVRREIGAGAFLRLFCLLQAGEQLPRTGHCALPGVLDSIQTLCLAYAGSLPPGCGYRVSEEQFRKEVQIVAATHRLSAAGTH